MRRRWELDTSVRTSRIAPCCAQKKAARRGVIESVQPGGGGNEAFENRFHSDLLHPCICPVLTFTFFLLCPIAALECQNKPCAVAEKPFRRQRQKGHKPWSNPLFAVQNRFLTDSNCT